MPTESVTSQGFFQPKWYLKLLKAFQGKQSFCLEKGSDCLRSPGAFMTQRGLESDSRRRPTSLHSPELRAQIKALPLSTWFSPIYRCKRLKQEY